jgi:hypothetical protein
VNTSDIDNRARTRLLTEWQERWNDSEMGRYYYSIVPRVSVEAWMVSAVDEMVFLVAMSRLASYHTGTCKGQYVFQDALCKFAIDHGIEKYTCNIKSKRSLFDIRLII